jgi:hypothetical protein
VLKETPEDGSFEKELEVLSRIRTPKLVFFYGACLSPKCCIVTELQEQGTLFDYMQLPQKQFGWYDILVFLSLLVGKKSLILPKKSVKEFTFCTLGNHQLFTEI